MADSDSLNEFEFDEDEEGFNSDDYDVFGDDNGDESDPLASDTEPAGPSTTAGRVTQTEERVLEEEVFGPAIDDLMAESSHQGRRKRRRRIGGADGPRVRSRACVIPAPLKPLMGSANMAFISKDYSRAEELLTQIIAEAPRAAAPLRTLGLIYESRGWQDRALECFMQAATSERTDHELWKRNAMIWKEKGNIDTAIKCLTQALKGNHEDVEALRARAHLYVRAGKLRNAADSFLKALRVDPFDLDCARSVVKCLLDVNDIHRADDALEEVTSESERRAAVSGKPVPGREEVIILLLELCTELKMQQHRFIDANMILVRLRGRSTAASLPLTFKHRLMVAVCQHRLGSDVLAAPVFQEFMSSYAEMDKHRFLLWQVADACHDSGHYHLAADAYSTLIEMKDEEPRVDKYLRRALCYKEINCRQGAKADLEMVLSIQPRHVVASLHYQEFLPKSGSGQKRRSKRALKLNAGARVSAKERTEACEVLNQANAMFNARDFEGYLLHVYAALDAALELRAPWRRNSRSRLAHRMSIITSGRGYSEIGEGNNTLVEGIEQGTVEGGRGIEVVEVGSLSTLNGNNGNGRVVVVGEQQQEEGGRGGGVEEDRIEPVTQNGVVGNMNPEFNNNTYNNLTAPPPKKRPRRWVESRRPPFDKAKMIRVGASLMQIIDYERFVQMAERITMSFREVGELELAHPITRIFHSLAHIRVNGDDKLRRKLRCLDLITSVASGAIWRGYDQARHLILDAPTDADLLYVLAMVETLCEGESDASGLRNRSYRGLARILKKNPTSACLSFVMANVSSRGGLNVQRYTVGFYLSALNLIPKNPLIYLCLGLQVLYVAMGRRIVNRNEAIPHAFAFLQNYCRYRKENGASDPQLKSIIDIEINYNLARAFHQIGIVDTACNLYERVLKNPQADSVPAYADLRREAAFNLMLIYRNSGNYELASKVCNESLIF